VRTAGFVARHSLSSSLIPLVDLLDGLLTNVHLHFMRLSFRRDFLSLGTETLWLAPLVIGSHGATAPAPTAVLQSLERRLG
jgi:hypothetical protein